MIQFHPARSAGGVVYRRNAQKIEFLLLRDRFGYLSLPKGREQAGEALQDTARRVVVEQTGFVPEVQDALLDASYRYQQSPERCVEVRHVALAA